MATTSTGTSTTTLGQQFTVNINFSQKSVTSKLKVESKTNSTSKPKLKPKPKLEPNTGMNSSMSPDVSKVCKASTSKSHKRMCEVEVNFGVTITNKFVISY